jgi:UDP-N-acetylglucosamine 2-epimerase (non-hydrolysing)
MNLLLIAGARPNFMKVAPIIKAIQAHNASCGPVVSGPVVPHIDYRLVHTGQHYDEKMSDIFFQELGIPAPDFNLGVGSGSHAAQTANIMLKFEPVLLNAFASAAPPSALPSPLPDWLVVVGDVNSTMACTLVASKLGVKVAHVEAGLRSNDRTMPEEINRLVTDALADLLLTPSEDANENLRREGVPEHKIKLVGNVMIDSLVANLVQARASCLPEKLSLRKKGFIYVTLHRPSSVDEKQSLEALLSELKSLAEQVPVVFPIHPRTRQRLTDFGLLFSHLADETDTARLLLLGPLGYHDSLWLTENACLVVTDSGGLQEESTYFKTPCLTLRPNTERPVTITSGSNRLTSLARLRYDIRDILGTNGRTSSVPPMWDGQTAQRIIRELTTSAG